MKTSATLPKISIVTPTYNCGHLIERCIQSVLAQDYALFEHIIVDGASSDDTVEVLQRYPHVRWISEPDTGEANAINKALASVTGDIICWLNADDLLCGDTFKKIAALFVTNPEWELVYGDAEFILSDGSVLGVKRPQPRLSFTHLLRWWNDGILPHQPSMFFSRRLLERVGPLNEALHYSIDLELWLRCALEAKLHYIGETLSKATQRQDCKSHNTVPQQIESHWKVVVPFLGHLSFDERVGFWAEYYLGRVNGSMPYVQQDPCRFPDSEEALLALVRVLSRAVSKDELLAHFFPDPQPQHLVKQLLQDRGLRLDGGAIAVCSESMIHSAADTPKPTIVLDGVFFQYGRSGIYRLWDNVLREWSASGFGRHIVVLDRSGYAPRYPGIRYRLMPPMSFSHLERETLCLEEVCAQEHASLFISTYYTSVRTVPNLVPIYDMIPEKLGVFAGAPEWAAKRIAIERASAFACISENTKKDLLELYPHIPSGCAAVTLCGVDNKRFQPASASEVSEFCKSAGLTKPYFVLSSGVYEYKNARLFFEAMRMLPSEAAYDVIVPGGVYSLKQLGAENARCEIFSGVLSDDDLRLAYAGALGFVYPSLYEGFGLPILEAMACGCPVITTTRSSMPEAAGDAALYADTADQLANALCEVQKPAIRQGLIVAGHERADCFPWKAMAIELQLLSQMLISQSLHMPVESQRL